MKVLRQSVLLCNKPTGFTDPPISPACGFR
jgi:hypothetical protein